MQDGTSRDHALRQETAALRVVLTKPEDTLRALHAGEADAFTVDTSSGVRLVTRDGAERPYRVIVEAMNEGAVSATLDGVIVYCNPCLAAMVGVERRKIIGSSLLTYFSDADTAGIATALRDSHMQHRRVQATLVASDATRLPVTVAMRSLVDGEPHRLAIVITDLSEIVASQEATLHRTEQNAAMLAASSDGY